MKISDGLQDSPLWHLGHLDDKFKTQAKVTGRNIKRGSDTFTEELKEDSGKARGHGFLSEKEGHGRGADASCECHLGSQRAGSRLVSDTSLRPPRQDSSR